jgi:beta-glucosidase
MHTGSVLDALRQRMTAGEVSYAVGYDIEGSVVPATALALRRTSASGGEPTPDSTIDFIGPRALPAGSSWTWTGTITAPSTGDYVLKLQTAGGRGTLTLDTPRRRQRQVAADEGDEAVVEAEARQACSRRSTA